MYFSTIILMHKIHSPYLVYADVLRYIRDALGTLMYNTRGIHIHHIHVLFNYFFYRERRSRQNNLIAVAKHIYLLQPV